MQREALEPPGKVILQFLAKARNFSLFSKSVVNKNWLKLGLFHVFVSSMVTESSKAPSFSLKL